MKVSMTPDSDSYVIGTTLKRGGIPQLNFLIELCKTAFPAVTHLVGSLQGEDGYADMQLDDEPRTAEWTRS